MNATPTETQAWHDACVARFAIPDPEVRTIAGRDWARIRPMRCANEGCGRIFYAWTDIDTLHQPNQVDPAPGARQTCGHPFCHRVEEERAFKAGYDRHRPPSR